MLPDFILNKISLEGALIIYIVSKHDKLYFSPNKLKHHENISRYYRLINNCRSLGITVYIVLKLTIMKTFEELFDHKFCDHCKEYSVTLIQSEEGEWLCPECEDKHTCKECGVITDEVPMSTDSLCFGCVSELQAIRDEYREDEPIDMPE